MADAPDFEGHTIGKVQFEMGGGGTSRATEMVVGEGDKVKVIAFANVVNVKHPFFDGKVNRLQTLNITDADIVEITERYVPPPEQATLAEAAPVNPPPGGGPEPTAN